MEAPLQEMRLGRPVVEIEDQQPIGPCAQGSSLEPRRQVAYLEEDLAEPQHEPVYGHPQHYQRMMWDEIAFYVDLLAKNSVRAYVWLKKAIWRVNERMKEGTSTTSSVEGLVERD